MTNQQVSALRTKVWSLPATVLTGWVLVALTSLIAALASRDLARLETVPTGQLLATEALSLVIWVLLSLPGLLVIRSLVGRGSAARQVLLSLVLGLLFALLFGAAEQQLVRLLVAPRYAAPAMSILPGLDMRILAFLVMVFLFRRRVRKGQPPLEVGPARPPLSRSEPGKVQPLVSELQAHLLFNALNDAAELVHIDPDAADDVITRLSDFLRATLAHAGQEQVALGQEMSFIRAYTEIQAVRLKDRLTVDWNFEPDTADATIPMFVWQPILENAFRHGIDHDTGRLELEIGARREGTDLVLWVRDHGPGLGEGLSEANRGIGLANTRDRLNRLYGASGLLEVRDVDDGVLALVRMPYSIFPAARAMP